jgi:glutaredoxin
MKLWIACFVSMLMTIAGSAVADMYKWVDENGKVHYTDSPPPKKKGDKERKVVSITGPAVISPYSGGAPGTRLAPAKVTIFTASWCDYCKKAKAFLTSRRIAFEDIDVERTPQGRDAFHNLGGNGVPVILVGAQRMDGYREATLDGLLRHAGL